MDFPCPQIKTSNHGSTSTSIVNCCIEIVCKKDIKRIEHFLSKFQDTVHILAMAWSCSQSMRMATPATDQMHINVLVRTAARWARTQFPRYPGHTRPAPLLATLCHLLNTCHRTTNFSPRTGKFQLMFISQIIQST